MTEKEKKEVENYAKGLAESIREGVTNITKILDYLGIAWK